MFRNLALIWTFLFWASLALAGGSQEEKGGSFALVSGLVLLGLLFSTALAGHLFFKAPDFTKGSSSPGLFDSCSGSDTRDL